MKKLLLTLLLAVIANGLMAQTVFYEKDFPESRYLSKIKFSTENIGWIIGSPNLKSTDGGYTWKVVDLSPVTSINNLEFTPDGKYGWIVSPNGGIFKTSNFGVTWENQNSGTTIDLTNLFVFNKDTVIVISQNSDVLRTVNGGIEWIKISTPLSMHYGTPIFGSINFINNDRGYISGHNLGSPSESILYETIDNGITWKELFVGGNGTLNIYNFTDKFIIFSSESCWYYTTDYFRTNIVISSVNLPNGIAVFLNETTGYSISYPLYKYHYVYKTTDGAKTWTPIRMIKSDAFFSGLCKDPANNIWVIFGTNTILSTKDLKANTQFVVDSTKNWAVMLKNNTQGITTNFTHTYKFTTDTMVNGHIFKKIYGTTDSTRKNWIFIQKLIRENSGYVFLYNINSEKQTILYNFNLNKNDVYKTTDNTGKVTEWLVENVDSVRYSGKLLKRISLRNNENQTDEWIEGIGSIWGVLNPVQYLNQIQSELLCVSGTGTQYYNNPKYNDCYIATAATFPESESIKLYPTTVTDFINIETTGKNYEITVCDINGRILIKEKAAGNKQIACSHLKSGIYILKYTNGKINKIVKFVKH